MIKSIFRRYIHSASDIHLEYYHKPGIMSFNKMKIEHNKHKNSLLCLCGDIGNPFLPLYGDFLGWCDRNYNKTLVITGNHEYYNLSNNGNTISDVDDKITSICDKLENVEFINRRSIECMGYTFIGATLWSHIPNNLDQRNIYKTNDFKHIMTQPKKYMCIDDYRYLHERDIYFIKNKIKEISKHKKIIIMTHHLPSYKMIYPKYSRQSSNMYFASNLDNFIQDNKNIEYWLCGHTHVPTEKEIGNTVVIANPIGFYGNKSAEMWNRDI